MKVQVLLAPIVVAASAFAQNAPSPSDPPFSVSIPAIKPGTNTAAMALPRLDWFQRVEAANNKARKQADKIQIVFDGDSITNGWETRGQAIWGDRYAKLGAFNFGIPSDRTQNVLWRLEHGQADDLHPKLIVLMIGTNNTGTHSAEQVAEGVQAIVAEYQKRCPGAVILLQAILPSGEKATSSARVKIKAINQLISKLGDGERVIYIDFGDKFLDAGGNISKEILYDFVHPTDKGYLIWADAIQPIIDRYLTPTPAAP